MQGVGIVAECDAGVGSQGIYVDSLVEIDNIFPLGVDFDEYFVLAHLFDDFSYIGTGFLEMVKFFP